MKLKGSYLQKSLSLSTVSSLLVKPADMSPYRSFKFDFSSKLVSKVNSLIFE